MICYTIEEDAMMQERKASGNSFKLLLLIKIKIHLAFMSCYFYKYNHSNEKKDIAALKRVYFQRCINIV